MSIRPPPVRALLLLAALPLAAGCRGELKLLVSMTSVTLAVGDSIRPQWAVVRQHSGPLNPSFYQYDNFDSPGRFTWRVSDPAVVSVDARGTIVALAPGTSVVTGRSRGLASPPLPVTVQPAAPPP